VRVPRVRLQQVELVDGLCVATLRGALLVLRRRVVVHRATRSVPLLLGGGEQIAPAVERGIEARERALDDLVREHVAARVPRGERGREIFVEEVQYAADATTRFVGNL